MTDEEEEDSYRPNLSNAFSEKALGLKPVPFVPDPRCNCGSTKLRIHAASCPVVALPK